MMTGHNKKRMYDKVHSFFTKKYGKGMKQMKTIKNSRKIKRAIWVMLALALAFVLVGNDPYKSMSNRNNINQEPAVNTTNITKPVRLMPVGAAVGIHIQTKGLMVLGTTEILTIDGTKAKPCGSLLESGDYILKANDQPVSTTDQLIEAINQHGKDKIVLTISRGGEISQVEVKPIQVGSGQYKLGVWLRDDTQGIGTLSFVDENNRFAALGHGIADIDTGQVVEISQGRLYPATIFSIVKSVDGVPGEMIGQISYGKDTSFGIVHMNTAAGIYGRLSQGSEYAYNAKKSLLTASKEEMEIGAATIMCQINGVVDEYQGKITGIDYNNNNKNKDFIIEITDQRLLNNTGGIIQGMSGSPIIQNGKIVGVVTHVFLNHASKGYGIFIENMLSKINNIS